MKRLNSFQVWALTRLHDTGHEDAQPVGNWVRVGDRRIYTRDGVASFILDRV